MSFTSSLASPFKFAIPFAWSGKSEQEQTNKWARLLGLIQSQKASLSETDPLNLVQRTRRLRDVIRQQPLDDQSLATAVVNVIESLKQSHGVELFDTQLRAGLIMCDGKVAEMATGEGKTFAGLIPSYINALDDRGVHVCLPNSYLAQRDEQQLQAPLGLLGMKTGIRLENDSLNVARRAYAADITYGAGQLFGFDYLRDQSIRREAASARIGSTIADRLIGRGIETRTRMRTLHCAIIDEADQVLIDDATSPLLITAGTDLPAHDTDLHHAARLIALSLKPDRDYVADPQSLRVELTESGFKRVYDSDEFACDQRLSRPWHGYVVAALKAEYQLQRDHHYVVIDSSIRLVEQSTGRIFADRTWSGGLHQAVQTKERLAVTAESESQGQISRQVFFRLYTKLCGMTGTAWSCRQEFRDIYSLDVARVATRVASRRRILPLSVSKNSAQKLEAVTAEVTALINRGRAVLIGTNHIDQSRRVATALQSCGFRPNVLNGTQTQDEASIVASAGTQGRITVATHLAGRGTDIRLQNPVRQAGGLHIIGWEHHRLQRVDRQLIGRGARQGDPGTARFYISPDDGFVAIHAPYLAGQVARCAESPEEINSLAKSIQAAQERMEADDRSARHELMLQSRRSRSALASAFESQESAGSPWKSMNLSRLGGRALQ